jgi:hypothetical protein
MANIPHTLTKLSQSLTLIAMHQTGESGYPDVLDPNILNAVSSVEYDKNLALNMGEFVASVKIIGETFGFRPNQTKVNYERRGMNSSIEAFAIVPGPQHTTIELNRSVLYLKDAMAAFQFVPGNVAFQTRPLIIIENITLPDAKEIDGLALGWNKGFTFDLQQTTPIIYMGCWISDSRISYDLKGSDQMVIQDITMNVARVMQPVSLIPIVGEQTESILAENTPIINEVEAAI